jgi:hypothetical protein
MGRKLNSLGFEKGTTGDGASAILWDEEKFMRIFSAYGLGETSETSEMSEMPGENSDVSDQSDVSDVFSPVHEEEKISIDFEVSNPLFEPEHLETLLQEGEDVDPLSGEI